MWGQEWVAAANALWSFDISTHVWQHRPTTGSMPEPALCCGMAVIGSQAYVLVNQHDDRFAHPARADTERQMEVYSLDLQTWHWTQLPSRGDAPACANFITPTVVQVSYQRLCQ